MSTAPFLNVPIAFGAPLGRADFRRAPEDFVVREWLGFEPDGEGEHVLLKVRKRGANTIWVAQQLARIANVPTSEIGYAGLKDRDAVAEQAFTVPYRSAIGLNWIGVSGEGFEVIAAARHSRKLKRGALKGNEFLIVLRDFSGDRAALEERLWLIAQRGVPNYFGPQRFGQGARNVAVAMRWFQGGVPPANRVQRGFAISAARSAIFNAVLAARVRAGTWDRLLDGDLANLDGTGSIFAVGSPDATLAARCAALDIHPTGPLWHGDSSAEGEVAELERCIANELPVLAQGLAQVGLRPERRALRVRVSELTWGFEGNDVKLSLRLPRGAFATAVLHEVIESVF